MKQIPHHSLFRAPWVILFASDITRELLGKTGFQFKSASNIKRGALHGWRHWRIMSPTGNVPASPRQRGRSLSSHYLQHLSTIASVALREFSSSRPRTFEPHPPCQTPCKRTPPNTAPYWRFRWRSESKFVNFFSIKMWLSSCPHKGLSCDIPIFTVHERWWVMEMSLSTPPQTVSHLSSTSSSFDMPSNNLYATHLGQRSSNETNHVAA